MAAWEGGQVNSNLQILGRTLLRQYTELVSCGVSLTDREEMRESYSLIDDLILISSQNKKKFVCSL